MRHDLWLILVAMFIWPSGIVVGNLIANLLWLPVQWAGLHIKLAAHHDEIKRMLGPCPNCGHRRSGHNLLHGMPANSIVEVSKEPEA